VGDVVFEIDRCRRDEHAAAECRIVRHELTNHGAGESVEHADVRSPARAGRGDDVVDSVAGGVGHGHTYAAAERRVVGQEPPHQVTVDVVNVDHRQAAGAGAHRRVRRRYRRHHDVVAVAAVICDPHRQRATNDDGPFRQIGKPVQIVKCADNGIRPVVVDHRKRVAGVELIGDRNTEVEGIVYSDCAAGDGADLASRGREEDQVTAVDQGKIADGQRADLTAGKRTVAGFHEPVGPSYGARRTRTDQSAAVEYDRADSAIDLNRRPGD